MGGDERVKSFFYAQISDFFKSRFPNIETAAELERDLLMQRLAKSGTFANTHIVIAKLLGQTEFSPAQVEQLVEIPDSNSQAGWRAMEGSDQRRV